MTEKKSDRSGAPGCAVSDNAQAAADRRAKVRNDLLGLATALEEQLTLENRLAVDIPEGVVQVRLNVSSTLAKQLEKSLRYAVKLI